MIRHARQASGGSPPPPPPLGSEPGQKAAQSSVASVREPRAVRQHTHRGVRRQHLLRELRIRMPAFPASRVRAGRQIVRTDRSQTCDRANDRMDLGSGEDMWEFDEGVPAS